MGQDPVVHYSPTQITKHPNDAVYMHGCYKKVLPKGLLACGRTENESFDCGGFVLMEKGSLDCGCTGSTENGSFTWGKAVKPDSPNGFEGAIPEGWGGWENAGW